MANLWVKRIGRQISLVFFTAILVVAWGMPSLAQLPFLPSPGQSSAPESHPWDLNQAFTCGKVWCSDVYLLKSDTWLKTALEQRTILTPELTVTAIGDPSEPPQEIAQQAEQRAELVQRVFSQTVKQVLDRSTLSTVPYQTNLSFWLPLSLQGLNLPIMVKPLHPWTPRVEIGTKNQQTVIFLPAQPDLGLASQVLVTLTAVDARANGKTIEQLAELWRVNIHLSFSNALWGFELDRQHPFLRWKLTGAILGATLLLILVIEAIRSLLRKWNHHLRHNLGILTGSLAIDPEALTGKKKDISSEQLKDGARTSSAANPSQHQGATKLFWGLSPFPLELGQNHHPRWILLVWRMIHWNLNQLLGLMANLYNLLKRISHTSKWLSPRFYISEQKRFLRKQTAIKQQRNFCSLLLAQMLITEILIFAVGLSMVLYIFRETRVFADVLFEKSIFLIAIWIALIFIDKVGAFLIDNYLNHWASEGQMTNPNSTRYTLRASTYSSTLKQATTFVVMLLGGYITMTSMGVHPSVLAGAGIFAVAIAFLARSLVEDMLNGILILWTDRFAIGDVIDLGTGMAGAVESITLFITSLRNLDGDSIAIPNSKISTVNNKTKYWSRVNFTIRIAWNQDIDKAMSIMTTVADAMQRETEWKERILEPAEILGVDDVSHEGILICLLIKTQPCEQWNVGREFRRRVKQAFDKAEIRVGIPHQTITLMPTVTDQGALN